MILTADDPWIRAHQLGYAACLVSGLHSNNRTHGDAVDVLEGHARRLFGSTPSVRRGYLRAMPRGMLWILSRATSSPQAGRLARRLRTDVDAALLFRSAGTSLVHAGAQTLAYHVLFGRRKSDSILSLARRLFGRSLPVNADSLGGAQYALDALRASSTPFDDRLEAIEALGVSLGGLAWWPHVRNALLQNQFAWPLLVVREAPTSAPPSEGAGFTLPVGVDVEFDGNGRTRIPDNLGLSALRQSLERALATAKGLWRSKHGNHGSFRSLVAGASVRFDFSAARLVIAELDEKSSDNSSGITGTSAEAYFAQQILRRFLGRPSALRSVVTGRIGDPVLLRDQTIGLDREFLPVEGLDDKVPLALESRAFEHVVLAADSVTSRAPSARRADPEAVAPDERIEYAATQYGVADIVQSVGWRQHVYVRCPEIPWAIRERNRLVGEGSAFGPRVLEAVRRIQENRTSGVLELDAHPTVVALALAHLNTTVREGFHRTPPSLSWAFFRFLPRQEIDSRFWQIVWRLTGADPGEFETLVQVGDTRAVVEAIADRLNTFVPDERRPSLRAPDVLVVMGHEHLVRALDRIPAPRSRPFLVMPILQRLRESGVLRPVLDEGAQILVGNTRVILLKDDRSFDMPSGRTWRPLEDDERERLRRLSIFPNGFTRSQAAALFEGDPNWSDALADLEGHDRLRRVDQTFYLRELVRQELGESVDLARVAELHDKVGCALAPFAVGQEAPGVSLESTFLPENAHDAEYHFEAVRSTIKDLRRRAITPGQGTDEARLAPLESRATKALDHFRLYVEPPGWGVLAKLLEGGWRAEAHAMAIELVEQQRLAGATVHPRCLLTAVVSATQVAEETLNQAMMAEEADPLRSRDLRSDARETQGLGLTWSRQAIRNATHFAGEERYGTLLAHYANALALAAAGETSTAEFAESRAKVFELLAARVNPRDVDMKDLDTLADGIGEHRPALEAYRTIHSLFPVHGQSWLKAMGCAELLGERATARDLRALRGAAETLEALKATRVANTFRPKTMAAFDERVRVRLAAGLRCLRIRWQGNTDVATIVEKYLIPCTRRARGRRAS